MDLKIHVSKKNFYWIKWSKIIFCSVLIGFVVGLVTLMFKNLVEEYEHILFSKAQSTKVMFFVLPLMGLGLIYCLRLFVFHNRKNKGISEVLEAVHFKKKLPAYKIPSHFFNGFLTVIFGGATGIEVSTVVATAAMGDLASKKEPIFKKYKKRIYGSCSSDRHLNIILQSVGRFFLFI
jgi:CIC family chloride channel protein